MVNNNCSTDAARPGVGGVGEVVANARNTRETG